ncbi:MAG: nucleotide sugar dehydrogenase [Planctomycetota bacterium]|nr:nucleotide sugar dehydrogenase [Planctomycetota bacterium]
MNSSIGADLLKKISSNRARVGVIGLGYVGLPLAIAFAKAGLPVTGFDIDNDKVDAINAGKSYIKHLPAAQIREITDRKNCSATSDFTRLHAADLVVICVPTPLTEHLEPDLQYIKSTVALVAEAVRRGQLIVLESTTYPGTTREVVLPALLEKRPDLKVGKDFFMAFSPEREDPGNPEHSLANTPKVIGGLTKDCAEIAGELYRRVTPNLVFVSSPEVAEATKLLENIFRGVNIALVNELKIVFDKMGLDVWEVIDAARTKPFGFTPFYPGPGLGGHCIPIDPFYLTWKAREYDCATRFIELSGEINRAMPEYVVGRLAGALNKVKKSVSGSKILILGFAYKKDVDDDRESPSWKLLDLLKKQDAKVDYHDPFIPKLKKTRQYDFTLSSSPCTAASVAKYDAVIIATAHSGVDYELVGKNAKIIIDTRNAMAGVKGVKATVVKA